MGIGAKFSPTTASANGIILWGVPPSLSPALGEPYLKVGVKQGPALGLHAPPGGSWKHCSERNWEKTTLLEASGPFGSHARGYSANCNLLLFTIHKAFSS